MAKAKTKASSGKADDSTNVQMAKALVNLLSDTYVLAVKTHGYHWNVMGPQFNGLHAFFEKVYDDLFDAADEIAERIRALGLMVDGSMDSFLQNTVIEEAGAKPLSAQEMLADLLESFEAMQARFVEAEEVSDDLDDVATQDLIVSRMREQDKTMWMIRSQIV